MWMFQTQQARFLNLGTGNSIELRSRDEPESPWKVDLDLQGSTVNLFEGPKDDAAQFFSALGCKFKEARLLVLDAHHEIAAFQKEEASRKRQAERRSSPSPAPPQPMRRPGELMEGPLKDLLRDLVERFG